MVDAIRAIFDYLIYYFSSLWNPSANIFANIISVIFGSTLFVLVVGGGISYIIGSLGCLISIIGKPFGFVIPFFDPDNATYTSEDVFMGRTNGTGMVSLSDTESKGHALRELYDDCSADLLEKEERDWETRNVTRVDDPSPASESESDDYWQTNTYDYN